MRRNKIATLLTTRSSGSSYLNRVELQNGCLSLGHSNTFIPSTLSGPNSNPETGQIDEERLRKNLSLAIMAYINRVNGCPCGDTQIKLYEGSTLEEHHATSAKLDIFLKGSRKQRCTLQKKHPTLFSHFQRIWSIRTSHMVPDLPSMYIFFLKCCFQPGCEHPVCLLGQPSRSPCWYCDGPPLSHLPLPVKDPSRPWGGENCSTCKGFCAGHYKTPMVDVTNPAALECVAKPPSLILKKMFAELDGKDVTEDFVTSAAESVLLSVEDTRIWLDHLGTVLKNRRRGAAKAAATRQLRKASASSSTHGCTSQAGASQSHMAHACAQSTSRPNVSVFQTSQTGASETTALLHTCTSQAPPTNASVSLVEASRTMCTILRANVSESDEAGALGNTYTTISQPRQANASASPVAQIGTTCIQPSQTIASVSQTRPSEPMDSPSQKELQDYCGTCGKDYYNCSESGFWVACDLCDRWYCSSCEHLSSEPTTDYYMCIKCME